MRPKIVQIRRYFQSKSQCIRAVYDFVVISAESLLPRMSRVII